MITTFETYILRSENNELAKLKDKIRKQHEVLTRENERLARKLEQILRIQGKNPNDYIVIEETNNLPKIETVQTQAVHPNYVSSFIILKYNMNHSLI